MELPRYVVLKYNDKYVSCVEDEGELHGCLQPSADQIINPLAKMAVEMAETGGGLVHLRCCRNNKYWVLQSDPRAQITASATEKLEDQSRRSCTLFRPVYSDDNKIRFVHVHLGFYVYVSGGGNPPFINCLSIKMDTSNTVDSTFEFVDWESLVIMPKYIAFKNSDGKYLGYQHSGFGALIFDFTDIGDSAVGMEIFTNNDGSISIKSISYGKFLRYVTVPRSSIELWELTDGPDDQFWPVMLQGNIIALRFYGSYCYEISGSPSWLSIGPTSIVEKTHLEVEEMVLKREIYNVRYKLSDARIYDQSILVMATGISTNMTSKADVHEIDLTYKNSKSSTWNISLSLKVGGKITFDAGIPFIIEEKIEISVEFQGSYSWGETKEESTELTDKYTATIPPMTEVKVSLMATKGMCDVPFSYTQRDTHYDGRQTTTVMTDGMYTGVNCYNFYHEAKEKKL